MNEEYSLEDVIIVLKRRLAFFLAPLIVIVPIGLIVIMLLPPLYEAQGKILVEDQQIPTALVQSTLNTYIDERLQTIRQRVTTRSRMLEVADKFDLFPRNLGISDSEKVRRMKSAFDVQVINAGSQKQKRNQPSNTIAFTVAYRDASPDKAFQVANEFMTLILSEDVRTRTEGAANATDFFAAETKRLSAAIDKSESEIAEFKAKHADALPQDLQAHQSSLLRAQQDLSNTRSMITQTEESITAMQTQIATYLAGSGGSSGPAQEILRLETQLAALRADKTEQHPDIIALKQQIASLKRQLAPSAAVQSLRKELAAADQALKDARGATPVDEELVKQRRAAATDARERLSAQIAREAAAGSADLMLTQLQGRMDMDGSRLVALEDQEETLKATIAKLEDSIARTPAVEGGLAQLTRDSQNLLSEYQALKNKQATAQLSMSLEEDQKAEKLSILESAQRPDKPTKPDRFQLAVLLIVAAMGAGISVAVAAEMILQTVRGRNHMVSLLKEAPIAVIPYFSADNEPRFKLPGFGRAKPA